MAKQPRKGVIAWARYDRPVLAFSILVVVIACAVYANSLGNEFVFDDRLLIEKNEVVQGKAGPVALLFSSYHAGGQGSDTGLYRPFTLGTFAWNYRVGGLDPRGYHLVNILLHAGVCLCVLALALRIGLGRGAALIGALLFAVHPIHTEDVANLAGRAEILACLFVLLALLVHARSHSFGIAGRVTAAALFLLAMLSKENAVTFVAVAAGYDLLVSTTEGAPARWLAGERWRALARSQVWLLGAVAIYFLLRLVALGSAFGGPEEISYIDNPLVDAGLVERWSTAFVIVARYIGLFLFPAVLSPDYSYAQIVPAGSPLELPVLLSLTLIVAVLGWLAWSVRRSASTAFLLWFSIATFSITSNTLLLIGTVMAERLLYLPSVGMCLLAATAFSWGWRRLGRWPAIVAAVLVLGAASIRTVDRNRDWRDGYALFSAAVRASPMSVKVRNNLGTELLKRGRPAEAKQEFLRALEIDPAYPTARINLAQCLLAEGDPEAAERAVREVLEERPDNGAALFQLGEVLYRAGRLEEAEASFRRVLELDGAHAGSRERLGALRLERGDPSGAEAQLLEAIRRAPESVSAQNTLGLVYLETGRYDAAARHFREAVRLTPDSAPLRVNLASALREAGKYDEAIRELERAREFATTGDAVPYALGLTHERAGRFREAREAYREAAGADAGSARAHRGLARTSLKTGRPEAALAHAGDAVRLDGDDPEAHALRARALFTLGRHPEAEKAYREVLRRNDRSVEARNSLGIIYALRGDRRAARAEWEEALRLAPDSTEIRDNLRKLGEPAP